MTPKCLPKRTRQKRRKGGGREKSGRRGGGREREGKWGERERKSVGNFNLPRVTKRLATPRIATACWIRNRTFRSTCTKKKRGGKIVAIEARCGCGRAYTHTRTHTRIRTRLDGSKYRLTSVAPSRNFVTSFPSRSGALPGFLLDFFPSLTPSTTSFIPITAPTTLAFAFPLSRDRLSIRQEKECFLRDADSPPRRGGIEFCWLDITVERWFARANPFTTITIAVGNRHARTKGNSNKSKTRSRPSFEPTMDG